MSIRSTSSSRTESFFGTRDVAAGAQRVSFEIGTAYEPGEYRVVALKGEETVTESTTDIVPEIQIQDVGLYRNNPDKPWDEVYGESKTDSKKNGEAFVTVQNSGSGPDTVVEMRFLETSLTLSKTPVEVESTRKRAS